MQISVVIRTFNEAESLDSVLKALMLQTISPEEIMIVDSGSTDQTVSIARNYGATILEMPKTDFTYGRSLNIGFAASKGDLLVPLSGHAMPAHREWLESLITPFSDTRVAASSSRVIPFPKSRPLHNYSLLWPFLLIRRPSINNLKVFWNTAAAYRKRVWEELPFNENLSACEDREWALRARRLGYHIAYEPSSVVWHYHGESYQEYLGRSFHASNVQISLFFKYTILQKIFWPIRRVRAVK